MAVTVWTSGRKWLGNLIPAFFWLIFAGYGLFRIVQAKQIVGIGLIFFMIATVVGWVALNFFGFFQNARMRRRLTLILAASRDLPPDRIFVGFSSPKYTGLLDAHEDVGFLCFTDKDLVFVSETRMLDLRRGDITQVRFRPNVHTMVGLGRWIAIDGTKKGVDVRMLIEPREWNTMLANLLYGKKLKKKILDWQADA